MAKKNKSSRRSGKPMSRSMALMIVCGVLAFIVAALPSVTILVIGMIPTVVA
jgi:hypothetical protein|tara:strand:- start:432 stop:587 length:156 start_codon:yes stop_codon:yes gene_type:complete